MEMYEYGEVEVQLYMLWSSVFMEVSCQLHIPSYLWGETPGYYQKGGWLCTRAGVDAVEKKMISTPAG